jgi:hypothetical protein
MEFTKLMEFPVNFPVTREKASAGVEFIDGNGGTPIAVTPVILSRHGWLTGRNVTNGNHSPNNGIYSPDEAAYRSSQN